MIDIAFVMYTGESIDQYHKGNFMKQIEFVKGLSKTFNVSRTDTNVGIITYAGDAAVRYRFEDITNQTELENALDTLTLSGSGRNIGKALDAAQKDLFNRSMPDRNYTVRDILVVIADGGSDDDIAVPTYALKEDDVTIFSVGIAQYVPGQLNEMASDPDSDHVFTIDNYDELGPTMAPLKDEIIRGLYRQTLVSKRAIFQIKNNFVSYFYYKIIYYDCALKCCANKEGWGFTLDNYKTSYVKVDNRSPIGILCFDHFVK